MTSFLKEATDCLVEVGTDMLESACGTKFAEFKAVLMSSDCLVKTDCNWSTS